MLRALFNTLLSKNKDKTIGVLYICTGKYNIFWERFYHSAEQNFCPGLSKHYFIFTDSEINPKAENVTVIEQSKLGWPYDTLMRFHMFNKVKDNAIKMDYLFFFNANIIFLRSVWPKEILPSETERLVAVRHPFFYDGTKGAPFEDNPQSTAFLNPNDAKHYVAGGLSGGFAADYLEMADQLAHNIDIDQKNGIIAKWHDESHINRYLAHQMNYKILDPGYLVPEKRLKSFPFKPRILVLDKVFAGGHEILRS